MELDPSGTSCPRCNSPLAVGAASDAVVLACHKCGGVWLDNPASVRAFQLLDAETIDVARHVDADAGAATVDFAREITCPVCRSAMVRSESPLAPVVIDRCLDHGTWLDRSELVTIADAVAKSRGVTLPAMKVAPPEAKGSTVPSSGPGIVTDIATTVGQDVGGAVLEGVFALIAGLLG
jgi:Zn-finger nucleic acid-binding protein